jgi:hypothetical protein
MADYSSTLMHPNQRNLSGAVDALAIEKFSGTVHYQLQKSTVTDGLFEFIPLVGTTTLSNYAMGEPTLQPLVAGVSLSGTKSEIGDQVVQVRQPIAAREIVGVLEDVQDKLNVKGRLPVTFGKKFAKAQDQILLLQAVKSARKLTGAGEVSSMPAGTIVELASANDETDSTDFEAGIRALAQGIAENDIDVMDDGRLFLAPAQYFTLLNNEKLTSTLYSMGNSNYAKARLLESCGMPVVMTNRLTQSADDGSDSTKNGYLMGANYTCSDEESDIVALYATSDSIMVAESIPMTTEVWWDKDSKSWFIDAYWAFGAAPNRPDKTGGVFKYRA